MPRAAPSSGGHWRCPLIKSILVSLDGSPFAEQALPPAFMIARACRAKLRLVKVHEPPPPPLAADDAGLFIEADLAVRQEERGYLRRQASRAREEAGLRVLIELLDDPIAEAIAEYVRSTDVGLVVMTTHGRGPLSRIWLGSVADGVIRRVTAPVLLIRPKEGAPAAVPERSQRILVPLDGSLLSETAVGPAAELAERLGLGLTLVHVVQPPPFFGDSVAVFPPADLDEWIELRRREAVDYLEDVAEPLRARGLQVETVAVVHTSITDALLALIGVAEVALVAISTHGRGGLQRLLLGSVADKLVRSSERPVLVVRPAGPAKARRTPVAVGARTKLKR